MEVILTKPIRKLGKALEVVKVKNGYGRNYLLKRALAVRASPENMDILEAKRQELEIKNKSAKEQAEQVVGSLQGKHLTFVAQAAADGKLFGSVSAKDIATQVSELINHKISYADVVLELPIKTTGLYNVQVALHPEVITQVKVVVAQSASEVTQILTESSVTEADREEV